MWIEGLKLREFFSLLLEVRGCYVIKCSRRVIGSIDYFGELIWRWEVECFRGEERYKWFRIEFWIIYRFRLFEVRGCVGVFYGNGE